LKTFLVATTGKEVKGGMYLTDRGWGYYLTSYNMQNGPNKKESPDPKRPRNSMINLKINQLRKKFSLQKADPKIETCEA
jgi:hypothetical protein